MSSTFPKIHPSWTVPEEDKNQHIVQTPYGRGLSVRTRKVEKGQDKPMREIRLLDWDPLIPSQEQQKKPILYSVVEYPSVRPMVGDDVLCLYGRGRVVSIIDNSMCVVKLTSWRLAGRSLVTCHLSLNSVRVVRKKTLREMDAYERVAFAQAQKAIASKLFGEKKYEKALTTYATAVDAIRYVQHDAHSNNELRADLLVVMITCCNNAATCSVHLTKWDEAVKFSKNALVLLDALYNKRGLRIHSILNRDGYSDAKLFGEWRIKSYLVIGHALTEKGDYNEALSNLKTAHDLVTEYTQNKTTDSASKRNLLSQENHRRKLYNTCIQQRKADRKKEKERALAMFGNGTNKSKLTTADAAKTGNSKSPAGSPSSVLDIKHSTEVGQGVFKDTQDSGFNEGTTQRISKKVSFSEVDEVTEIERNVEEEDEDMAWYDEHKEALILTAACGLAVASIFLLRKRSK